ncbi:MAG: exonuclease domain-containing protein [Lachnospiraceae bacterium]|nr:exonuclease domain-containing protein [Lachnospiraceae bacterium]
MSLIVLDLEWNQSSTGREPEAASLPFEIIEIGAVRLGDGCRMIGEFSELIKPQVYTKMHTYTSKLIHLQMKQLEKGSPFQEVMERFFQWCSREDLICTWGSSDVTELQRNLLFFGLEPIGRGPVPYLDVQKLFSLAYEEDRKIRRNLEYAVDFLKIEKDIPFHRAFSDAYYTAAVLKALVEKDASLLDYISYDVTFPPTGREEEIHARFRNYEKYITRVFPTKEALLSDREVKALPCFVCGKNLRLTIRWFSTNDRHYYAAGVCEKHGYMKGKIRVRHLEGDSVFAVKTTKLTDPTEMRDIEKKHNKTAMLRMRRRQGGSQEDQKS